MHLHANAVLTVRQRQRLCDLVASGVYDHSRPLWSLVVPVRRRRSGSTAVAAVRGWLIAPVGRAWSPRRTPAEVEEAILLARELLREGPHVIG